MKKSELILTASILLALVLGVLVGEFLIHRPVLNELPLPAAAAAADSARPDSAVDPRDAADADPAPESPVIPEGDEPGETGAGATATDEDAAPETVQPGVNGDLPPPSAVATGAAADVREQIKAERRERLADATAPWEAIGNLLFIRPLRMMIIPLVFVSVVVGVTSIGSPEKLGLLGGSTLLYYITTMLAAIGLGLILVTLFGPGRGVPPEALDLDMAGFEAKRSAIEQGQEAGLGDAFLNLFEQMIPTNPIAAAAEGNTLGVVVVSLLLGLSLVLIGERGRPAVAVFEALFAALLKLVVWIIWLAPIGVFALVTARIGSTGLATFVGPIGWYALTVVLGLLLHALVSLPAILFLLGKANPYDFLWRMRKPLLTAFSTASSSATLPITIEEAETSGKCSKRASNFVLPLGATVNMDGTALYQAVAVVFLFQVYGINLSLTELLVILITATLSAVGAAAIPSAGLVTMAIVITAVNRSLGAVSGDASLELPLESIAIILGIDRLLDMCRTCVNVWGDSVGAKLMSRLAPDEEEPGVASAGGGG